MRSSIDETSKQKNKPPRSRFSQWRDERAVKRTVRRWHKSERKAARRGRFGDLLQRVPHAGVIGDVLYMFGFWLEYGAVCAGRTTVRAATAILSHVWALLFAIFRPLAAGLIVFLEDLLQPFVRLYSGVRHIRELPEQYPEESRKEIRAEKFRYFKRGTKRYLPLVWNVFTYLLPAGALVCLALVIQGQLSQTYRLEVRVNGETVGYVESEQVFDNARDDVQSRIASARAVMEASGVETTDAQWDITPTYTLAVSDQVMTESEVADAILRASSDEIGDGTAVYIDGNLSFVTTEGDHLRAYLDAIKAPYEDAFDANRRVEFVHDIRLVDGVYFLSSIVPYDTVISTLSAVTPAATYTVPEDGQTAAEAAESAGVDLTTLQAYNTGLEDGDTELTAGTTLALAQPVTELLQVKVIERQTYVEDVQQGASVPQAASVRSGGEAIGPLLTTTWGQDWPYNALCPSNVFGALYPAGCVATAAAQIMNYHRWPERGTGSVECSGETLDLSTHVYDWGNMLDRYDSPYTKTQGDAVAKLMWHIGASANVIYGLDVSTTPTFPIERVLREVFGCSTTRLADKMFYSWEKWKELMRTEIDDGRPSFIFAANSTASVGHGFVCDGYDAVGLFHINWGWSGEMNGYFQASTLDPYGGDVSNQYNA